MLCGGGSLANIAMNFQAQLFIGGESDCQRLNKNCVPWR